MAHRNLSMKFPANRHSRQRGFTAIEVAMVATVIAILALIVLPLFRNRVDEAKIAAAQADLASLMKAQIVAQADTGYYFRLEDLDNVAGNTPANPPNTGITIETPPIYFTAPGGSAEIPRGISAAEWFSLAGPSTSPRFKGPYASFSRAITYQELRNAPIALYVLRSAVGPINYRAIRDIPNAGFLPAPADSRLFDSLLNRYPVDPWGNPYLFFPPSSESAYNFAAIYSLGPDGLPADDAIRTAFGATVVQAAHFTREGVNFTNPNDDILGKGDDLEVRF